MTLQLKTGDWVKLRNGAVEQVESVHPRTMSVRLKDFYPVSHYPDGHFYPELDHELDIIAIVDAPERLPEPQEMLLSVFDNHWNVFHIKSPFKEWAQKDVKFYRCTVTPVELVKP